MNVGHFYFRRGRYEAALARFSYVIQHYPDMGQYHEALEFIARCKQKIAEEKEEAERAKQKEKPQA